MAAGRPESSWGFGPSGGMGRSQGRLTASKELPMTQRLDYQKPSAAGVRAVGGVYVYVTNAG